MPHNGPMLMGNKKAQRITVGVIIGVMVVSLALSLISTAERDPVGRRIRPQHRGARRLAPARTRARGGPSPADFVPAPDDC